MATIHFHVNEQRMNNRDSYLNLCQYELKFPMQFKCNLQNNSEYSIQFKPKLFRVIEKV